jgi:hypothetical protein
MFRKHNKELKNKIKKFRKAKIIIDMRGYQWYSKEKFRNTNFKER